MVLGSAWLDASHSVYELEINPLRTVVAYMRQGNKYFTVR